MQKTIIDALNWRYATKKFDESKIISTEDLETILESIRLTPSSYGLQPWKFLVIKNPELREKLKNVAYGQTQITDASHLIVLCAKTEITENVVDKIASGNDGYKSMIMGSVAGRNTDELLSWNAKQVYIALGFLMETSALLGVDSCPMEGFDSNKVDEILELDKKGLKSIVLCPIGYRSIDDKYASTKKLRFSKQEIIEVLE